MKPAPDLLGNIVTVEGEKQNRVKDSVSLLLIAVCSAFDFPILEYKIQITS